MWEKWTVFTTIFYSVVKDLYLVYSLCFVSPKVSHEFAINFNPTNPFCSGESHR